MEIGSKAKRLVVAALLSAVALAGRAATTPTPNIILFLADDMGIGDTSAYRDLTGNSSTYQIDTPNLERLAAMGTRFTDVHTPASLCAPTRLGLMTGAYSFRSPLTQTSNIGQDQQATFLGGRGTWPEMLRDAGYAVYGIGKWHMALQVDDVTGKVFEGPLQNGFDRYTGTPGNFASKAVLMVDNQYMQYDTSGNLVPLGDPNAQPWIRWNRDQMQSEIDAQYELIQQTELDAARAYLVDHVANRSQDPFMLYYASHGNHIPWHTGAELAGQTLTGENLNGEQLPVVWYPDPLTGLPVHDVVNDPNYDLGWSLHWDPYTALDEHGELISTSPTERAKMVQENDIIMGELLDYLQATDDPRNPGHKLIDSTLIIFTSDNGADIAGESHIGRLPQSSDGVITDIAGQKATTFEGGTRVPFIAAWADEFQVGATSDALFGLTDIYATLVAVLGRTLEPSEAPDSENVLAALKGEESGVVRNTDLMYKSGAWMVIRRGEMKLVVRDLDAPQDDRFNEEIDFENVEVRQLYDLSVDLGETINLSNDPAYKNLIAEMLDTVETFASEGYSRAGAMAVKNALTFQGGDIGDPLSWHSYSASVNQTLPTGGRLGQIFMDGLSATTVSDRNFTQGGGVIEFTSDKRNHNIIVNSAWRLEGGAVNASMAVNSSPAFKIHNSGIYIDGGRLDLSGKIIRADIGDAIIEVTGGEIEAQRLLMNRLVMATAGSKILQMGAGNGEVRFTHADPIIFGNNDGDSSDDYVNFLTGSRGRITGIVGQDYYESLWNNGELRIDGVPGGSFGLTFAEGGFEVQDNNDGTWSLMLSETRLAPVRPATVPVEADSNWAFVEAASDFLDPVVIAGPPTYHNDHPGVVRLRNITDLGFELRFQEWNYGDTTHDVEYVPYAVVQAGRHLMSDGSVGNPAPSTSAVPRCGRLCPSVCPSPSPHTCS